MLGGNGLHEILGSLLQKHVVVALPSVVDVRIMEEGLEVVEGGIAVSSEDGPRGLCGGRTVPADSRFGTGRDSVELGHVFEVAENIRVLKVSFGEVETRRDLHKGLSNVRNESILCQCIINDYHFIVFLCVLKLLSIAGVSQGHSRGLQCS